MTGWIRRLFGCGHKHYTWPMGRRPTVQCLDCGRRIRYDWDRMRLTEALDDQPMGIYERRPETTGVLLPKLRDLHHE